MSELWSFEEWTEQPPADTERLIEEMALGVSEAQAKRDHRLWLQRFLPKPRPRLRLHGWSYFLRPSKR